MTSTSSIITRRRKRRSLSTALRNGLLAALCVLALLPAGHALSSDYVPTSMSVAMVVPEDMQLFPLRVMHRDAISIFDLVYDSLVIINDDQQPEPSLATSWKIDADGKTWTFTIRDNVYFHDGRKLTAYDVGATIDAIKATVSASEEASQQGPYAVLPYIVKSWEVDDDLTLRVRTDRPYYGLLYAMTFPVLNSLTAHEENPPGTGAYAIDYYVPGETLWLRGNENWWGGPPPHIVEIICRWYDSDTSALAAFEAEYVDIVMTRSTDAARYRGTLSSRASSYTYSTRQMECLLINHSVAMLGKDVRIRQAIAYAINTAYLKTNVYQGLALESGTLQPPGSWLYNEEADGAYSYRPDEARRLLDAMGYSQFDEKGYRFKQTDSGPQELSLRLFYFSEAGNNLRKEAASQIATMLGEVGIKISRITPYDFAGGSGKLSVGDYDLFLCAINFDVTPDPTFLLSTVNTNYSRYRSEAMAGILKELRKVYEPEDFQYQWLEIQRQMAEDAPFVPLYWRQGVLLTRYPFSSIRDIREFELLRSIELYK